MLFAGVRYCESVGEIELVSLSVHITAKKIVAAKDQDIAVKALITIVHCKMSLVYILCNIPA